MDSIEMLLSGEAQQQTKETKFTPLQIKRIFTGLWTQRNPFNPPGTRADERFYGGHPDALIDGNNVEITNSSTLARRPGFLSYTTLPTAPQGFFTHRRLDTSIHVISDIAGAVCDGPNLFFTKGTTNQTFFESVGNTLFMANGTDLKKWSGPNLLKQSQLFNTSPWGKNTLSVSDLSAVDPLGGSTAAVCTSTGTDGYMYQTITATAGQVLTASVWLWVGSGTRTMNLFITDASSNGLTSCALTTTPTRFTVTHTVAAGSTSATIQIGGGATLPNGAQIIVWEAQLEHGVQATSYDATTTYAHSVSNWGITAPITAASLSFASGPLNITSGYTYCYTYKNSNTGHISTASPISASTGKRSSTNVQLLGAASTDPQVDTVQIYRITDGGSTYLLLAEITNPGGGNWSYTDTSVDTALNTLIQAPLAHVNDPPPAGMINPIFHSGRLWGSVGNIVYYSGGPQTTNGSGNEAWPPANYFVFPAKVTRMVPYANGLFIFTVDQLWAIWGTDPTSYYSKLYYEGLGLLSYNALAVEGSEIFLFSADRQVVEISPSSQAGFLEIGFGIADLFEAIDPTKAYVTSHIAGHRDKAVYISDGSTLIYRCNPNQAPEGGPTWSPKAVITGGVGAIASVEITPGTNKLLIGNNRNLVPDSDLRYGSTYWGLSSWTGTESGTGAVSGNAFQYTGTGAASGFLFPQSAIITVSPGSQYTVSGYIDASHVSAGSLPIIAVYDPAISTAYAQQTQAAGTNGRVTNTFTVPAGVTQVRVIFDTSNCTVTNGQTLTFSNPQLELGSTSTAYQSGAGSVQMRDLNTFSDNGIAYSASATIGSLVLAQPGQLAEVQSVTTELKAIGTQPAVSVLLDEISGTFETLTNSVNDPPQLPASTSLLSNRFYLSQGTLPKVLRHMQIKLGFATEAAANELLSLTVYGAIHPE